LIDDMANDFRSSLNFVNMKNIWK